MLWKFPVSTLATDELLCYSMVLQIRSLKEYNIETLCGVILHKTERSLTSCILCRWMPNKYILLKTWDFLNHWNSSTGKIWCCWISGENPHSFLFLLNLYWQQSQRALSCTNIHVLLTSMFNSNQGLPPPSLAGGSECSLLRVILGKDFPVINTWFKAIEAKNKIK